MKTYLHIGLPGCGIDRVQSVLKDKSEKLADMGVMLTQAAGGRNNTRLFVASTDPDHIEPFKEKRGFTGRKAQRSLRSMVSQGLKSEAEINAPDVLIMGAGQLATGLFRRSEIERLKEIIAPVADDLSIVMHVDEQARVLARHYAEQLWAGRTASLAREFEAVQSGNWRATTLQMWEDDIAAGGLAPDINAPPFWLDYQGVVTAWEEVFGKGTVDLRRYDETVFASPDVTKEIVSCFGFENPIGKAEQDPLSGHPSAASLTRARLLNEGLHRLIAQDRFVTGYLWQRMLADVSIPGDILAPGSLSKISDHFLQSNAALSATYKDLGPLAPDAPLPDWQEADPEYGYRATQYLAAFLPRINAATRKMKLEFEQRAQRGADLELSPEAEKILSPIAKATFETLKHGGFAPHNQIGTDDDEQLGDQYTPVPLRDLPADNSGKVIVGCMKNEAPYILEWVAYHRAIGVDNFLIYTNACEDNTDDILGRLQEMGLLQHRLNNNWKGKSPQQHALNQSLKEDAIKNAEWVIHIDVDEYINVRCGNGTIDDFIAAVPNATNVAMTWRLFGHNGVERFEDRLVIDQFETCAPKFCPKPHTVWGFKTMTRNIGAYDKISCHRPTKPRPERMKDVTWVNGSGRPMGDKAKQGGWRSSKFTIGYDLIQLNHYALRSAESFLIKRQRGRALHVDRSIGINYWIRMDWDDHKDLSIKRNLDRTRQELDRLLQDPTLRRLHDEGVAWHKAKANELHENPEFEDLYQKALGIKLNAMERVSFSMALDIET